jgi:transcriptional regulator with XRE-family HTH domain
MNERTVNKTLLKVWLKQNGPKIEDGIENLAKKSRTSASTVTKVKSGYVPRKDITRILLANAIGVAEDELFPLVGAKGKRSA